MRSRESPPTEQYARCVESSKRVRYRRPAEIQRRYDPDNLFPMDQNIQPLAAPRTQQ